MFLVNLYDFCVMFFMIPKETKVQSFMCTQVIFDNRQVHDSYHEDEPHEGHHFLSACVIPVGECPPITGRRGADSMLGLSIGLSHQHRTGEECMKKFHGGASAQRALCGPVSCVKAGHSGVVSVSDILYVYRKSTYLCCTRIMQF